MPDDLQRLERDARQCVEKAYARLLSDEEWATARENLLSLARLVRDWHQPANDDHQAA
jgi:hypothetical protein